MTLTQAAFWTRRFGVLGLGAVALLGVFTIIVLNLPGRDPLPNYLVADFACTATKEEFIPNKLNIPSISLAEGSQKVYQIDTASGKLDRLPLIANVYRYDNQGPSLNAQAEAKEIAKKLALNPDRAQRRGTLAYYWTADQYGRSLQVETRTLNFNLETDFSNSEAYPKEHKGLPTDEQAKQIAITFLQSNGWMLEDYKKERQLVTLINIEPDGSFSEARSRAEAELLRVDFYRAKPFLSVRSDIERADEIKAGLEKEYLDYKTSTETIVTDQGKVDVYNFNAEVFHVDTQKSNVTVYVGPEDTRKKDFEFNEIYDVDYKGWVIEPVPCGTYELISATQVVNIIESGEGSLVYLNEKDGDNVVPYQPMRVENFTVNEVVLGYLDTENESEFLQPIYIVLGEATFTSGKSGTFYYYIPAINYDAVQNRAVEPAATAETTE